MNVTIKALEWDEITVARSNEDPTHEPTGDYEACTPFGHYEIEQYFGSDSYGWQVTFDTFVVADKDDPDAAKAAAQSHYESRIRSALIPAPSVAEAAEPVAWATVPREPTPEMVGAWYRVKNGHHFHDEPPPTDRSDYAAYRALIAAAPSPVVPSGLEALVERLRSAGCHYGIPVERDFAEAADAIAALIAERDEAHGMIEIIKKAHGVSIENGNVLRSDLSAALNWIAEIEGETREHEPVAYMVHNAMIVRNVNSIRQPGEIDETTVWLYPAARADHAREAAKTLRADLTPLYRKVQADDE